MMLVKIRGFLVFSVNQKGISSRVQTGSPEDSVGQKGGSEFLPLNPPVYRQSPDPVRGYGRVAGEAPRHIFRQIGGNDTGGGKGVEAGNRAGLVESDETARNVSPDILSDLGFEILVECACSAVECRSDVLAQPLDSERASHNSESRIKARW